jgi:hypothetical protein
MYLNERQLELFNSNLVKLKKQRKISKYSISNMKRLIGDNNKKIIVEKEATMASLHFINREIIKIQKDISKYPYLKEEYESLIYHCTKITNCRTYLYILGQIQRIEVAMGIKLDPRIIFQLDNVFKNTYYDPIIYQEFKDPYVKSKKSRKHL